VNLLAGHLIGALRPAAPPPAQGGSIMPWLVAVVVLAVIVASGVYLTSRR
jgi:hypothetical protein